MGEWIEIEVGNNSEILPGFAFDSKNFVDKTTGIPLVRIRDLKREYTEINYSGKYDEKYTISKGETLIGMDGEFHVVRWIGESALLNQRVLKVTSKNGIDNTFLYYHLLEELVKIQQITSGTTVKHLSNSDVAKIRINVPKSQKEQSTIATILSTVDKAIDQTEKLIAKYERIKTGLMQDLLTKGIDEQGNIRSEETHEFKDSPLGKIPKEWDVKSISECVRIINGGTPKTSIPDFWGEDFYWLSVEDFNNGNRYVFESTKSITRLGLKNSSTNILQKGMLIISARGTVGVIAQLGRDMTFNQSCYGLDSRKEFLDNNYLYYSLTYAMNKIKAISFGNVFDTITKKSFESIFIPIPSSKEQNKIVTNMDSIGDHINKLKKSLDKNKLLKTALMQDILTGKVSVEPLLQKETAIV